MQFSGHRDPDRTDSGRFLKEGEMLSKTLTAVVRGLEGNAVTVETDISPGLPNFSVVGLADESVKEARDRIRAACVNSGMKWPDGRITVNMAPAWIRKRGSHLDLAEALGILTASGQVIGRGTEKTGLIGELSLDGLLSETKGVLPLVQALKEAGAEEVIIPYRNRREAELVTGIRVLPAGSLWEVISHFNRKKTLSEFRREENESFISPASQYTEDYSDVKGQEFAKRALMVAAAGGHCILMVGSPATGKTMLAKRMPGILPEMDKEEIMQATVIHSVAGELNPDVGAVLKRPFRAPHYSVTRAALIGGGQVPRPGEISLASGGVLFLDELTEFMPGVIDALRTPLEERKITIVRQGETAVFPADFLLVAAANPCKCGKYGDPDGGCTCTPAEIMRYRHKISGPVLDRIDMHIRLTPVKYDDLKDKYSLSTKEMKEMVMTARRRQHERFSGGRFGKNVRVNARIPEHFLEEAVPLDDETEGILRQAYTVMHLDPRTVARTRKIARTVADIEDSPGVNKEHIMEALGYRQQEFGGRP